MIERGCGGICIILVSGAKGPDGASKCRVCLCLVIKMANIKSCVEFWAVRYSNVRESGCWRGLDYIVEYLRRRFGSRQSWTELLIFSFLVVLVQGTHSSSMKFSSCVVYHSSRLQISYFNVLLSDVRKPQPAQPAKSLQWPYRYWNVTSHTD